MKRHELNLIKYGKHQLFDYGLSQDL